MRRDCTDPDTSPRDRVIDELEGNWLVSIATLPRLPRFPLSRNASALPCRDTCALPSSHRSTRHAFGRAPPVTPLLTPSRNAFAPPRVVVQHSPPHACRRSPPSVTLPLPPRVVVCVDTAAIATSAGFIVIVALSAAAVGGGVGAAHGGGIRRR